MKYHYTIILEWLKLKRLAIPDVGKDVKQVELSFAAIRNVVCYNHFGNKSGSFLKGTVQLPHDPAILLLIYSPKRVESIYSYKDLRTNIDTSFFLITKNWK